MGITAAAGVPVYDNKLFPEWLSSQVLLAYRRTTCIEQITTTDYTAQLSQGGNKVTITGVPTITVTDYEKGAQSPIEYVDPTTVELDVDKAKEWGFPVFDVDRAQMTLKSYWDQVAGQAGKDMSEAIESAFFSDIIDDADADNLGATAGKISSAYALGTAASPVSVTASTISAKMMEMGAVLTEQDVPDEGRYMVISPYLAQLYLQSDLGKVYISGDKTSMMRNGYLAPLWNFKIYVSNRLPSAGRAVIFGHKNAIVFFTQLEKTKRIQGRTDVFSDEWHGLQVYGYKAIRPKGFGVAYLAA